MADFQSRIIRAAKLDYRLYEEVEADKDAMSQALTVVVLSSVAAGLAGLSQHGWIQLVTGTIGALIGWFVWAYVTYFIGTRILPVEKTHATHGELLRTIGFASAPGLIQILGIIPGITAIITFVAGIWMLAAMIVAVRQALDYDSTLRAVGVCFIGWIFYAVINVLVYLLIG